MSWIDASAYREELSFLLPADIFKAVTIRGDI